MTQSDLGDAVRDLEDLGKTNADLHNECDYVLKNFMIRQNAPWCPQGAPLQKGCKEGTFAALAADIQKYTADAAQLTKEIAELDEDISIWQGDIDAATNVGISKRRTMTRFTRIILNLLMPCSEPSQS